MRVLASILVGLAALLALAPPAQAQVQPRYAVLEREGLALEARLDYDGAFDRYGKALLDAVAERKGGDLDAAHAAGEVFVYKLAFLADRAARWKDLRSLLARVRKAAPPPLLDARAAWTEARSALAGGDIAAAEKLVAGLGFVTRFAIAGPFENDRGGGFGVAYDPEKGPIELSARYAGKNREIGWVTPSRDAFLGEVDLDALLRPNDEALAYALTYVRWEGEPRPAALRVGSDEGTKIWWNEDLVLSRDVNRTLEMDQDAVPIVLRKGWNRLLLKVAERKGDWGFQVRITDPDGRPLERPLAAEPSVAAADAKAEPAGVAKAPVAVKRGAIDWFEGLDKAGKATAHDLFQLGYLHYRRHAHDEQAHPDREAFQKAVAAEPKNALYRTYLSFVSGETGEFSVNREENPRRQELERALELDPAHARAALQLADYYHRSLRQPEKAEVFVDKALAVNPGSVDARLLKAELVGAQGGTALGRALVLALEKDAAARRVPQALARIAGARRSLGDFAAAETILAEALALDFAGGGIRRSLLDARKARGDLAGALALLADRARLAPYDTGVCMERASFLAGADRLAEAVAEIDAALKLCPDDDAAVAERGKLLHRMGKDTAALADFDRALALDPKLVEVRRYVEFLRADERPFEADYRLDAEEAIRAARDIPLDKEVAARALLDNVVAKVNRDGTSSEYEQHVIRIENDDGIERYDWYGVSYAVGEQKVTFRRATVVKPDGRRLEARIDVGQAERGGGEFTTYARRGVDLPTLEVGDVVVVEHRTDDLKQSFFGDYFGTMHFFQGFEPVERSRFTLVVPAGKPFYFNPRKLDIEPVRTESQDGSTITYVWEKRRIARIEQEPNMPPYEEVAPAIQVSTFKDWNAFSRWYWNLVHKQQELSDEMRVKVAELVVGKTTREEKIRAIYDFVVTDVRYNDKWEFGVHGFKPYNASSIFTRRFGDCKDKATLIITLLKAVDIPAFPVLIDGQSERGIEDYTLPLMSHFNHCIAYVPGPAPDGSDGWFLDGTATHHEATNLPNMDRGAKTLIVKPDGGEIKAVKWPEPLQENGLKERHRVAVRADGGAVIDAEIDPSGVYGPVVREQFQNPGQRKESLEKIYGRHFAGATVLSEDFGDLADLGKPVRVGFRLDVPKFMKQASGGLSLEEVPSVLFGWIYTDRMSEYATAGERKYDVVLPVPSGVEETIEYALPDGFTLKSTPEGARLDTEFGTYQKTYEVTGKMLRVTRRLVVKTQRVPVERYTEWRAWTKAIDRAEDARAILGKGGLQE